MSTVLIIIAAALLGSMLFFPVVVAPLVFRTLPAEHAGQFLRSMFPRYYLWGLVMSLIGLLAALRLSLIDSLIMAATVAGFAVSRQLLMPAINQARDLAAETRNPAHARRFRNLHGASVGINLLQILLLAVLLGILTAGA
jgi:hypothetical protein